MFRIGEFSKIAQVSGRLLRYYDQIGLFSPARVDPESGYRYYSAQQLPQLNRILALKDLGLSLDQIAHLLDDGISPGEIRGMLLMKKAQIAQTLQEEIQRLRVIESRLQQIEDEGTLTDYDVVMKQIAARPFLGIRKHCDDLAVTVRLANEMHRLLPERVGALGRFAVIIHSDVFDLADLDLEMGFFLEDPIGAEPGTLSTGDVLSVRTLPAVSTMLTAVRVGNAEMGHLAYGAIGAWVEANGYRFAGPGREVFLQWPDPQGEREAVAEIQMPVEPLSAEHTSIEELI
ncbi:MAG: MerR family transcriptional regulator [Chloroflexi bacterium]|nr:MerR family transcriptional regulator [Chloroflexota bacterium]